MFASVLLLAGCSAVDASAECDEAGLPVQRRYARLHRGSEDFHARHAPAVAVKLLGGEGLVVGGEAMDGTCAV